MESLPLIATAVGLMVSISTTVLGGTKWMLNRVEQRSDQRFAQVDRRFAEVDQRFAQVDQRFAQVDQRFAQVDQRFAQVERRFAEVDEQLRAVSASLTEVKISVARLEGPHPPVPHRARLIRRGNDGCRGPRAPASGVCSVRVSCGRRGSPR
ncbi:response regulator [Microbacterium sp. 1P10AE]|uniref:response regulator n=1 Tax=Microbacterium sp. 1P10AE TaxID=3132286 RepID=UPI0039A2A1FB